MDERFTYLVQKHLDNNLEGAEVIGFDKYPENHDCINYLKDAEVANKIMEDGIRQMFADQEMMKGILDDIKFDNICMGEIVRNINMLQTQIIPE